MNSTIRGILGATLVACAVHLSPGEEDGSPLGMPPISLSGHSYLAVVDSQFGYYRLDPAFLEGEGWQPGEPLEVEMSVIQENALRALSEIYPDIEWNLTRASIAAYGGIEVRNWCLALTFRAEDQHYTVLAAPSGRIFPVGMTHPVTRQGEIEPIAFQPCSYGPNPDPFGPPPDPEEEDEQATKERWTPKDLDQARFEWIPGIPLPLDGGIRELLDRGRREQQIAAPPDGPLQPTINFYMEALDEKMRTWMVHLIFGDIMDPTVWTHVQLTPSGTLVRGISIKE